MVNKIPKSEDGHTTTILWNNNKYYITNNTVKKQFTLWKIDDSAGYNQYEKLNTANSPIKLYEKIDKLEGDYFEKK